MSDSPAAPLTGFAAATAVEPDGDGFAGAVHDGWDIAGNANGGYLLAVLVRALREIAGKPDVVAATAHYLSPGRPGRVRIDGTLLKTGKTFATATGNMSADDKMLLHASATFGDLSRVTGAMERLDAGPPDLPDPDDCFGFEGNEAFAPPLMRQIDLRLHPDDVGFVTGRPHGRALMRGWFRLLDDEPMDTLALLLAVDAFPPTAFNAALPVAWTPTIELTVHARHRPAPGWLRCAFTNHYVTGGFLEEDGLVWDSADRLVAQSRQLALLPRS